MIELEKHPEHRLSPEYLLAYAATFSHLSHCTKIGSFLYL